MITLTILKWGMGGCTEVQPDFVRLTWGFRLRVYVHTTLTEYREITRLYQRRFRLGVQCGVWQWPRNCPLNYYTMLITRYANNGETCTNSLQLSYSTFLFDKLSWIFHSFPNHKKDSIPCLESLINLLSIIWTAERFQKWKSLGLIIHLGSLPDSSWDHSWL